MSFDVELIDKKTKKTVKMNRSLFIRSAESPAMYDENTGKLLSMPQEEAVICIPNNYNSYFYEVTKEDERFVNHSEKEDRYGIYGLRGKTAIESIPLLKDMISRITKKYKNTDGSWLVAKRKRTHFFDWHGNEIHNPGRYILSDVPYTKTKEKYEISEGDTSDFWEATAANAIEILWSMVFIATDQMMNENAVWDI